MTNVTAKGTIKAATDEVWKTLSSFRNVEKYIPLVNLIIPRGKTLSWRNMDYHLTLTIEYYKRRKISIGVCMYQTDSFLW